MDKTPKVAMLDIASSVKAKRLAFDLTQAGLANRSGVSLGAIKLFEQTGKISLASLLKIAVVLEATDGFELLFSANSAEELSLDEMLEKSKRRKQRGTIT